MVSIIEYIYHVFEILLESFRDSSFLNRFFLSLQALHKKLLNVETLQRGGKVEGFSKDIYWQGDQEIVHAVWKLVHMCGSNDANEVRELVSDFISRVMILLVLDFSDYMQLHFFSLLEIWFLCSSCVAIGWHWRPILCCIPSS